MLRLLAPSLFLCLTNNCASFLFPFRFWGGESNKRIKKYSHHQIFPLWLSPFSAMLKMSFSTGKLCKCLFLFPSRIFIVLCSHLSFSSGIGLDVQCEIKIELNCFSQTSASCLNTIF